MFHLPEIGNVLRPEVALHAEDVLTFVGSQLFVGIERIDLPHGQVLHLSQRLELLLLRLTIVQIAVGVGRHDDRVARLGCGDSALRTAPRHHGGRFRDSAL